MGAFDDPLGSLLVGSWIAIVLYGMALMQATHYYKTFPNDTWQRKSLLGAALLLCFVALLGDTANAYIPMVTYWGNPEALGSTWALPIYAAFNTSVGVVVDFYLISRFYGLSKNLYITLFLCFLVLASLSAALAACVILELFTSLADRSKAQTAGTIWTLTLAAADLSIALCLIWKLRQMKTSFKKTNSLIRRLCLGAIQTGSVTSFIALVLLITFMHKSASNIPTFFVYLLGPCYLHTLLYNFNLRDQPEGQSGPWALTSTTHNNNNITNGIQVYRSAVVTMDNIPDFEPVARRRDEEEGASAKAKHATEAEPCEVKTAHCD